MTIIIGLTGGIASGKTTILKFVKNQNIPTYDSDLYVSHLYQKPTKEFLDYLKLIGLSGAVRNKKIDKKIIRKEVFKDIKKLKRLEKYIHPKTKISRNDFIKKNTKLGKKIIMLDIPLLFENKLENICNYVFLANCSLKIRLIRALKRKDMDKNILLKIIKTQISDKIKKKKSDFIINTSVSKNYSNKQVLSAINTIKKDNKI